MNPRSIPETRVLVGSFGSKLKGFAFGRDDRRWGAQRIQGKLRSGDFTTLTCQIRRDGTGCQWPHDWYKHDQGRKAARHREKPKRFWQGSTPLTSPLWFTAPAPAAMLGSSAGKLTCRREVNDQNTSNIMANKSAKSKQQKSKAKKPAAKKSAGKKK